MTTEFTSLNLRPELEQAILELGYITPTGIQAEMIPLMLTGVDVIGQAQTGTGKTAAFAFPILHNFIHQRLPQALILAPTRELAVQVASAMEQYGKHLKVRVLAVYGGQPYGPQVNQLKRGVDIVVGTPGRIIDLMARKVLDLSMIKSVVLDEADEMLNMGFIEPVEEILSATPAARQTALFSATLPVRIRHLADRFMRDPQSITIKKSTLTVSAIEQRYYLVHEGDKLAALTNLFEIEPITSALIFVRTRVETGQLASQLSSRGFPAEALNGDLEQNAREQILGRFRAGQIKVLVATDVAARGLDIDDISHVFNYHLPDDAEVYVHRIGRTGRAGKTGIAISLFAPREKRRLREIEHMTKQALTLGKLPTAADINQHREDQVLEQMKIWLGRGRYQRERELVARLVEEGHDAMEIAAAALKLSRADEKQRPVANVTDVAASEGRSSSYRDRGDREYGRGKPQSRDGKRDFGKRGERDSGNKRASHEAGMIRLKLNKGKENGVRPNDIVGTIAHHADIPGSSIGKIRIEDKFTYVDVPEALVEKVLKHNGNYRIGKDKFTLVKS
ncbi:MAG: DEAD/DEAH box helicase [Anaerolineales bacterium]|uniref:DEAD/DEAH box helicase n=1 Tax=Candidatus Villigracilis proximus TaxID=3140683 RepID=UPI003136530B|nr:DEAD/DEAH box helicase [Anaerolineales bacterium]